MATRVKKDKPNAMTEEQINRASEIVTSLFKKHDAVNIDRRHLCKILVGQLLLNTNSDKEFHGILKNSISDYFTTSANKNHYYANMNLDLDPQIRTLFSTSGNYRSMSESKMVRVGGHWTYSHKMSKGRAVVLQSGERLSTSYTRLKSDLTIYSTQSTYLLTPQWS